MTSRRSGLLTQKQSPTCSWIVRGIRGQLTRALQPMFHIEHGFRHSLLSRPRDSYNRGKVDLDETEASSTSRRRGRRPMSSFTSGVVDLLRGARPDSATATLWLHCSRRKPNLCPGGSSGGWTIASAGGVSDRRPASGSLPGRPAAARALRQVQGHAFRRLGPAAGGGSDSSRSTVATSEPCRETGTARSRLMRAAARRSWRLGWPVDFTTPSRARHAPRSGRAADPCTRCARSRRPRGAPAPAFRAAQQQRGRPPAGPDQERGHQALHSCPGPAEERPGTLGGPAAAVRRISSDGRRTT